MKTPQDPPRLLDPGSDAPAWLRASLEPGARDLPGAARLSWIAAGLPLGPLGPVPPDAHGPGDVPPAPPVAPVAPVAPGLSSMFSGAAVGAVLGLAVVGAGWFASPRAAEPPPPARPAPSAVVAAPASEPRSLVETTPEARPRPRAERLAPLSGATGGRATPVESEPAGVVEPVPAPGAASVPGPAVAESERAILERAQDALRGNPAEALVLTDLHLARFPGGVLGQEREVIAIDALLHLGRSADARARAARFVAAFPTSAHRRRLDVLIPDLESSTGVHKDASDRPSTP